MSDCIPGEARDPRSATCYSAPYRRFLTGLPPEKEIVGAVATGTDVNNKELQSTIVNLINANYMTIIAELVKLKKLKLA